ncbi:MAG: hypothetical protein KatS3mg108_0846 [Isosphaeraceae bacterium]|jgi:hypothetical protein|nr:MAG: hypothetical protein KatS3mg108_0846 [Isosphaeraceae bacterium]
MRSRINRTLLLPLLFALSVICGCGEEGSGPSVPDTIPRTGEAATPTSETTGTAAESAAGKAKGLQGLAPAGPQD